MLGVERATQLVTVLESASGSLGARVPFPRSTARRGPCYAGDPLYVHQAVV